MLNEFITQNYLIIENNIVSNIVMWNGNTQDWTPPSGSLALVSANTPVKVWVANTQTDPWTWELTEVAGALPAVGFTWDGTYCITNQPMPEPVIASPNQPVATGVTTI